VDWEEPERLAESIKIMGITHAVITSVDRDDLPDGGAAFWAKTIEILKTSVPELTMEVLIPDFDGKPDLIDIVIKAGPDIISHNLETVRRLTSVIRSRAKYDTSLSVIRQISESGLPAKSGIMLGLGEYEREIYETIEDIYNTGCRILTLGQYLQPSLQHMPVETYVQPEKFSAYRHFALKKGFSHVESNPLVRSSYHAEKHINK
jgi:lipoic acid synthetase